MFKTLPEGWYSRYGHNYCCRVCSTTYDVKYKRVKVTLKSGQEMTSLEPYTPSLREKLIDFFRK